MNDTVDRVREDLAIMEEAVGLSLPFDRRDVRSVAKGGLLAVPLALFGWQGPPGPPYQGIAIVLTLLVLFGLSWASAAKASRERDTAPARWREHRSGIALFVFLMIALFAYLVVGLWGGLSWDLIVPTAVFAGGVAIGVQGVGDPSHRYVLAGSLTTIAYAIVIPFCDDAQLALATAGWIALTAATTSLLMSWQLDAAETPEAR